MLLKCTDGRRLALGCFAVIALCLADVSGHWPADVCRAEAAGQKRGTKERRRSRRKEGGRKMASFQQHPGVIKTLDVYSNTVTHVSVEDVPDERRFVYLKDGVETTPDEATERVPIVEVHILTLDEQGSLVSKEKATSIRIKEFGPDHRPLRSTLMVKQ